MTFKKLRWRLCRGDQLVRWSPSGIIELASLTPNGAVAITNIVTGYCYILPRKYRTVNVDIVKLEAGSKVFLGSLLPKTGLR